MNPDSTKPAHRSKESYARSPGRPPDTMIDQRVAEAAAILGSRPNIHRCQLHKLLRPRWLTVTGQPCHWKTVDRLVGRARALLLERLNRPKEEFRCDVLAAYERELTSDKSGVRLAALAGIRQLLGLDAPLRTELSGPDGGPITTVGAQVHVYLPDNRRGVLAPVRVVERDAPSQLPAAPGGDGP